MSPSIDMPWPGDLDAALEKERLNNAWFAARIRPFFAGLVLAASIGAGHGPAFAPLEGTTALTAGFFVLSVGLVLAGRWRSEWYLRAHRSVPILDLPFLAYVQWHAIQANAEPAAIFAIGTGLMAMFLFFSMMTLHARTLLFALLAALASTAWLGAVAHAHWVLVAAASSALVGSAAAAAYLMSRMIAMTRTLLADVQQLRELEARVARSERLATLGETAAMVAHEVATPLSSSSLSIEMLETRLAGFADGDERDLLRAASDGLQRATRMLKDFRQLGRGNDGPPVPVDVNRVVKGAIGIVGREVMRRARLDVTLDATREVNGWDLRLAQVVLNLLRNAAQALPPDEAEAHVVTVVTRDEADGVTIRIVDDGPGIPEAQRARLFRPFQTTRAEGTGLGLALSHRIVTAHGGTIRLEPGTGRGCSFVVTLPAVAPAPVAAPTP